MEPERSTLRRHAARGVAALVFAGLVVAAVLARRHGVDAESVKATLLSLGCFAPVLFLGLFALAELLHLPGIVFVAVARVVFGPAAGFALGYAGALLSLTVAFVVARQLVRAARATREPWRPRWRPLARAFERIETHPVRTIALLRLVFWLAPPLTYALATTRVRLRDHLFGCALGLVVPVLAVDLFGGLL